MSFDSLQKELLKMAKELENGKEAKKFLRSAGNKLQKKTVAKAESKTKKKTGYYIKSIKRGKVYEFDGALSIRTYSTASHAHLIESGHIIKGKDGKEKGFKKGYHIFEETAKEFEEEFEESVEKFIDDLIAKNYE